jgi:hypothetical protein
VRSADVGARPTDDPHLDLLAVLDQLTQHRLRVDVALAWEQLHGARPAAGDWMMIRIAVAQLERRGLVQSDPSLAVEVTDAGREALTARARRPASDGAEDASYDRC